MIVCTFAGHRKIFGFRQQQVIETLEKLLETEQKMICYVGGKGEFDTLCASAVRTLKRRHPLQASYHRLQPLDGRPHRLSDSIGMA